MNLAGRLVKGSERIQQTTTTEYREWRKQFIAGRLRVAAIVVAIVSVLIFTANFIFGSDHPRDILTSAAVMSVLLLIMWFFADRAPRLIIAITIWVGALLTMMGSFNLFVDDGMPTDMLPIAQLSFILFGAVIFFPVHWRTHIVAHLAMWASLFVILFGFNLDGALADGMGWIWLVCTELVSVSAVVLMEQLQQRQVETMTLLRTTEARYRTLFDNSSEGIFRAGLDGKLKMVNPALANMLGYDTVRDMLLDDPTLDSFFVNPGEMEELEHRFDRSGQVQSRLINMRRRDGSPLQVMLSASTADSVENSLGYEGFIHDLTSHEQTRAALQRSEQRLESILDAFPQYVYWLDTDLNFAGSNRLFSHHLLKRHRYELVGLAHRDMPWGAEAEKLQVWERSVLETGQALRHNLWESEQFFGRKAWIGVNVVPLYDEEESVNGVLVMLSDVTERRETNMSLQSSEAILAGSGVSAEQLLRSDSWRAEIQDVLTRVGTAADVCRVYLLQLVEQEGQARMHQIAEWQSPEIAPVVTEDDFRLNQSLFADHLAILETGMAISGTVSELTERDNDLWKQYGITSLAAFPVFVGEQLWGLVGFDSVTRRRNWSPLEMDALRVVGATIGAAIEREQTQQELLQAQKIEGIGVLAGGIAHDFNNLLTGILGQSSLALAKMGSDDPAARNIEKAVVSAERASDLTRQLLAYAGKGRFQITSVNVNQLIGENLALFEMALPANVDLSLDLQENLASVRADIGQMQQLIMNLVINAGDAMREVQTGLLAIRTQNRHLDAPRYSPGYRGNRKLDAGEYVKITIADTGVGMDIDTLARIFDPYFTTKSFGKGLGLAATLGIIRTHGGTLEVASEPGTGTVFQIWLPAVKEEVELEEEPMNQQHTWNATILVVDDEEIVREAVSDILDLHGLRVLTARNGLEGVNVYKQEVENIDLVLMDMKMPGMNGRDAFRAMRVFDPSVKVIMSSGYSEMDISERFDPGEVAAFLQKPYDFDTLINTIRGLLAQLVA